MWLMADNARHTIMCPHCSAGISGMTTYQVTYMSDKKKSMFGISPKKINFISVLLQRIKNPSPLFMYLVHLRLARAKLLAHEWFFGVHMLCFLTQWFHPRCACWRKNLSKFQWPSLPCCKTLINRESSWKICQLKDLFWNLEHTRIFSSCFDDGICHECLGLTSACFPFCSLWCNPP